LHRGHKVRSDFLFNQDTSTLASRRFIYFSKTKHIRYVSIIDAKTGEILYNEKSGIEYDGQGKVFKPDPVTYLQDPTLLDNNNTNYAEIKDAYTSVILQGLQPPVGGLYYLNGEFTRSIDEIEPSYPLATSSDGTFNYNRSQFQFEEVNIYYFVDQEIRYIRNLGFTPSFGGHPLYFDAHIGDGNTQYLPDLKELVFGDDGVDAGEDHTVIIHELGHALHDVLLPYPGLLGNISFDTQKITEGVGDYLAYSYKKTQSSFMQYVLAPWYSSGRPDPPRVINTDFSNFKYPAQWNGIHDPAGKLWASTLVDVEERAGYGLGRDITTKLLLESFHYTLYDNLVYDQVQAIFKADKNISEYNGSHLKSLGRIFYDRGFFDHDNNNQNNHIYAGDITANKTISIIGWVDSDIRIKNGVTVTIAPNTFLYLNNSSKIIVENGGSIVFQSDPTGGVNLISYDNSEITINSGGSLNLTNCYAQPGSNFKITSYGYCFIDGFNVSGSQTWSGIILNGSGANNSVIKNSVIKNVLTYGGSALSFLGAQNPTIANCNISNNVNYGTSGIFLYNSGNPIIHDNTISANGGFGIRLNSTNGYIWLNTISSNPSGSVDCYSYASPSFGASGFPAYNGNNTMSGGAYGVQAASYCSPLVGSQNTSYYGYNSITVTSTARVNSTSYSSVLAEQNWWGSRSPSSFWFVADGTSWIDYIPYLIEEPGGMEQGAPLFVVDRPTETATGSTKIPAVAESREIPDSVFQMLQSAIRLRFAGNIAGATSIAKRILENFSSTPTAGLAAAELLQVYRVSRDPLIVEASEKIWKSDPTVNPAVGTALSKLLLEYGRVEDAVSVLKELAQEKMPEDIRKSAMLDLVYLGIAGVATPTGQEEVLKTLSDKYPNDPNVLQAQWLLQTMSKSPAPQQPGAQLPTKTHETINGLAIENYPNPFNPSTTVRYELSTLVHVTLKLYNVVGQEVETLVDEMQEGGVKSIVFKAGNLATGTYFLRLQAGNLLVTKKVQLLK
jgi:parallel beta-helix repeat protein